jgi:hypothetical protein
MALGACALEQSERERSEGKQIGEGERALVWSPHLCNTPSVIVTKIFAMSSYALQNIHD